MIPFLVLIILFSGNATNSFAGENSCNLKNLGGRGCSTPQAPRVDANTNGGGVTLNGRFDVPGQSENSSVRPGSKRYSGRNGVSVSEESSPQPAKRKGTPFRGACFPGDRISNFICIPDAVDPATAAAGAAAVAAKLPAAVAGRGAITVSDIADFIPSETSHLMEPGGWTIRGLPANFIAYPGQGAKDGVLLGLPASVRFTPVAFRWDYGDGETVLLAHGGDTWRNLGVPEFAATETSHVYRDRGTFTVTLAIAYTAEYRFDAGEWQPIDGTATTSSDPVAVIVSDAATVLVGKNCSPQNRGPGC